MEPAKPIRVHGDDRKRSRSPPAHERGKRRRSRSPERRRHHHQHREKAPQVPLPFRGQPLHKHDFEAYRALFAEYLDLQKLLDIDALSEREVKGRWRSFLGKWNGAELADGWYDPETKKKADARVSNTPNPTKRALVQSSAENIGREKSKRADESGDEDNDDDTFGPMLPQMENGSRKGPSVPSLQDLQYREELAEEDREARLADLRHQRREDRNVQRERLEELVPRAQPGSRERQLEKKRDAAASNRAFRDAKDAGDREVGDGELMGDDDAVASYKAEMRAKEKHRTERAIRKEEVLRARAVEREEKVAVYRRKEEKTMDMLRALAQQRFGVEGDGDGDSG